MSNYNDLDTKPLTDADDAEAAAEAAMNNRDVNGVVEFHTSLAEHTRRNDQVQRSRFSEDADGPDSDESYSPSKRLGRARTRSRSRHRSRSRSRSRSIVDSSDENEYERDEESNSSPVTPSKRASKDDTPGREVHYAPRAAAGGNERIARTPHRAERTREKTLSPSRTLDKRKTPVRDESTSPARTPGPNRKKLRAVTPSREKTPVKSPARFPGRKPPPLRKSPGPSKPAPACPLDNILTVMNTENFVEPARLAGAKEGRKEAVKPLVMSELYSSGSDDDDGDEGNPSDSPQQALPLFEVEVKEEPEASTGKRAGGAGGEMSVEERTRVESMLDAMLLHLPPLPTLTHKRTDTAEEARGAQQALLVEAMDKLALADPNHAAASLAAHACREIARLRDLPPVRHPFDPQVCHWLGSLQFEPQRDAPPGSINEAILLGDVEETAERIRQYVCGSASERGRLWHVGMRFSPVFFLLAACDSPLPDGRVVWGVEAMHAALSPLLVDHHMVNVHRQVVADWWTRDSGTQATKRQPAYVWAAMNGRVNEVYSVLSNAVAHAAFLAYGAGNNPPAQPVAMPLEHWQKHIQQADDRGDEPESVLLASVIYEHSGLFILLMEYELYNASSLALSINYAAHRGNVVFLRRLTGASRCASAAFQRLDTDPPIVRAAAAGHWQCVDFLLNDCRVDTTRFHSDKYGHNAILAAAYFDQEDVFSRLYPLYTTDRMTGVACDGSTLLCMFAENGRSDWVSRELRRFGCDVHSGSPAARALARGYPQVAHAILAHPPSFQTGRILTPQAQTHLNNVLRVAVANGDDEWIEKATRMGAVKERTGDPCARRRWDPSARPNRGGRMEEAVVRVEMGNVGR